MISQQVQYRVDFMWKSGNAGMVSARLFDTPEDAHGRVQALLGNKAIATVTLKKVVTVTSVTVEQHWVAFHPVAVQPAK